MTHQDDKQQRQNDMNAEQIATAIKVLMVARDEEGKDVQAVIDVLFDKFNELTAGSGYLTIDNDDYANTMARMG